MRIAVAALSLMLMTSCSHLSKEQKKWASSAGCAIVGGMVGANAGKNSNSPNANALAHGSLAGWACYAAADNFIKDDRDKMIEDLRAENTNIKRGLIDGRLEDRDRDDVLKIGRPKQNNCKGELRLIAVCPDESGTVKACHGPIGWQYVDKSWAVKWVAYKSVNNCFVPPYRAPQQIENLTNELERNLKK